MQNKNGNYPGIQISQEVDATATVLIQNSQAEESLRKVYLFPDKNEARLVYVDSTIAPIRPEERIAPLYFAASPADGLTAKSAMALIAPEDDQKGPLPESWGTWDDGRLVWERNGA
ncbi:MAG TPA: hypothetical protein VFJ58_17580 [Armatimonadota bacterium]|nr:hypothetical protein [Armatimonadota bacterium]